MNRENMSPAEKERRDLRGPKRLVLKACGKHYGEAPGPCAKCRHFERLKSSPAYRAGTQYDGTPWMGAGCK